MRTNNLHNLDFAIAAILLWLAAGCKPATPIPSTSAPLGETQLRWSSGPVVAIIWTGGESLLTYFSPPPESIVYSDGRQIVWHEGRLYEKRLSMQELCRILVEIDDSGFFNYTSDEYEQFYTSHDLKPGPESSLMMIDSWKSNSLRLHSFPFLFSQYKETVKWPAALRIPYEQLTMFEPDAMDPYVPDRVAVHLEKDPGLGTELAVKKWGLTSPSLSELIERYNETATPASETSEGEIILSGSEGGRVLEQFDGLAWGGLSIFESNGDRYLVAIRALLPYEAGGGIAQPLIPDPHIEQSPTAMSCDAK